MDVSGKVNAQERISDVGNRVDVSTHQMRFILDQFLIDALKWDHAEMQTYAELSGHTVTVSPRGVDEMVESHIP